MEAAAFQISFVSIFYGESAELHIQDVNDSDHCLHSINAAFLYVL